MPSLKKSTKIAALCLIIFAVLATGFFLFFSHSTVFSNYTSVFSKCKFDPEINQKNKALIDETITTVADTGLFSLLGEKSHLEEMGTILSNEVPDLSYWAYILSNPQLVPKVKLIQDSSPKYNGFIEGTRDRILKEYHENPCFLEEAKGFAEYLGLPEDQTVAVLKECIEKNEEDDESFKAFLDFIIANAKPTTAS